MHSRVGERSLKELNNTTPMTPSVTPPKMKSPMKVGLAFLLIRESGWKRFGCCCPGRRFTSSEEFPDRRISGGFQQLARAALRAHGAGIGVEENRVVADGKDARQLVGDDHERGAEAVAQLENQLIEVAGTD